MISALIAGFGTVPNRVEALTTVDVAAEVPVVEIGSTLTITLHADIDDPVLAFGLDFAFDSAIFSLSGSPSVGPGWIEVPASDGDGLAGVALSAISGSNRLLASIELMAVGVGSSLLSASITFGDPAEGFILSSGGISAIQFNETVVSVTEPVPVPEPRAAFLLALGLGLLAHRRHVG